MDKVSVHIYFREQTKFGEYCDTLIFTPEQWASTTPEEVQAMKQVRVDNWVKLIEDSQNQPELPTEPEVVDGE